MVYSQYLRSTFGAVMLYLSEEPLTPDHQGDIQHGYTYTQLNADKAVVDKFTYKR